MKRKKIVALLCAMATSSSLVMPVMAADPAAEVQTQETTTETSERNIAENTDSEDATVTEEMPVEENQDNSEENENTQNAEQNDQSGIVSEQQTTDSDAAIPTDGLYQDDQGNWYYYENGTMIQDQIVDFEDSETGESYSCFFQDNGIMLISDNLYWIEYFNENGENICGYICTDENGHLLKNQIVDFEDPATGESYSVFFGYNGIMERGVYRYWVGYSDQDKDEFICTDENGHILKNFWHEELYYDENSICHTENTYYGADGFLCINEIAEVNGAKYYFDQNGYMVKNQYILVDGLLYNADQNGKLTVIDTSKKNGWQQTGTEWYYYQNGVMVKNSFCKINGKDYYFGEDGKMQTGIFWVSDDSKNYLAQPSGSVVLNHAGWFKSTENGATYYFDEEYNVAFSGFYEIDGKTYYFDYDGKMQTGAFEAWDAESGDLKVFYANANGVIEKKQGWLQVDSKWKYIKEDNTWAKNEFLKVNGSTYYFDCDGIMQKGIFEVYSEEDGTNYYYYAGESGAIVTQKQWLSKGSVWYYIKENGKLAKNELAEINGKTYYFSEEGIMQTGIISVYDNNTMTSNYYYADDTGSIVTQKGWLRYKNNWYYVKDAGKLASNEIVDSGYYISYDGRMAVNQFVDDGKTHYYVNSSGKVCKNGWIEHKFGWSYADKDGKLYTDRWVGKYYLNSNGITVTGAYEIDGTIYVFNDDGVYQRKVTKKGWQLADGNWYYYNEDGTPYNGWLDDKFYISKGKMMTNVFVRINDEKTNYVGYDGTVQKGWIHEIGNAWSYADSDGTVVSNDWRFIAGKWYYFDGISMVYDTIKEIDGVTYLFDENGAEVKSIYTIGWLQDKDGRWFFKDKTGLVKDTIREINGITYYFAYDGHMYANECASVLVDGSYGFYWIDANGKIDTKDGWKYDGEHYYYVLNGKIATGEQTINGKEYYLIPEMIIGIYDGELYGSSGAKIKVTTGWYSVVNNGQTDWYYFKDGSLYSGWLGKYYISCGKMATGIVYCWPFGQRMFDKDGNFCENKWVYYANNWFYVGVAGKLYTGQRTINGKTYWFNDQGILVK